MKDKTKGQIMKNVMLILLGSALAACGQTYYAFTNFAGAPGVWGTADGTGSAARFGDPSGVAVDRTGNVYVADTGNNTIREITPTGVVTTLAGGSYGCADGTGSTASFANPYGIAVDGGGNLYVADRNNYTIRKVTPAGVVTTLAGSCGQSGSADGTGSAASFGDPVAVAVDGTTSTNVYVADSANYTIRKITRTGVVTTLAGYPGQSGTNDGTGSAARFTRPVGVAADSSGNVYVNDSGSIRKVTRFGAVTTLHLTGDALSAPQGGALDSAGNFYVAEYYANTVKRITIIPYGVVTTLGGASGMGGSADGVWTQARFLYPAAVAVDVAGAVYVADRVNDRISKGVPYVGPPLIFSQPLNQRVPAAATVGFEVQAVGGSPITYQWQHNGMDILGATNSSFAVTNAAPADSGAYSVLVTNSLGSVLSSNAMLTVTAPAYVMTLPASVISASGAQLNGMVQAAASGTSAWFEWGTTTGYGNVAGATNLPDGGRISYLSTTLAGLAPGQVYHHHLVVSNAWGTAYGADQQFALDGRILVNLSWLTPPTVVTGVVAVSAGGANGAVLRNDGTATVWGDNTYGQTNLPAGLTNLAGIAVGAVHILALRGNGTVVAWGDNSYGESTVPAGLSNVIALAASPGYYSLALRNDGTVAAWGNNSYVPPGLTNAVAIAAGNGGFLALRVDGTVLAWGANNSQCDCANLPEGLTNVVAISSGVSHNVALKSDGTVVAWGYNGNGQTNAPNGLSNVVAVAATYYGGLALKGDGTVAAWGNAALPAGATGLVAIAGGGEAGACCADLTLALVPLLAPGATTLAPCCVSSNAATLYASVGPNGFTTTAYFRWGATTNYDNLTATIIAGAGSSPVILSNAIGGLLPGATYHYRVEASNTVGIATGADVTFTTADLPRGISSVALLAQGQFQLGFTGGPDVSYTIIASPDISLPGTNWIVLGAAEALGGGAYRYIDLDATNYPIRFYQLRSP
jgi:sugar lactone lactonase YvrE